MNYERRDIPGYPGYQADTDGNIWSVKRAHPRGRCEVTLTFGSLFAGIGGFDLGFERAGMRCEWQVEIDPFCQRVLAKHWPDVQRYADVRECGKHNLKKVDIICGGFPCQPHSNAGLRKGSQDERDLWPDFARLVRQLRPEWVVAENVPGLLSSDAGRFFGGILAELAALGYDAEWEVLPAASFGAPHIRERVWIVAHSQQIRRPSTPFTAGLDTKDHRKSQEAWQKNGGVSVREHGGRLWCFPNTGTFRIPDGLSDWVDRLGALGNAVVPQVTEWIGRRIVEVTQ